MKYRAIKEKAGQLSVDEVFDVKAELKEVAMDLNWHIQGMINKWVTNQYPLDERFEFAQRVISGNGKHKFELKKLVIISNWTLVTTPGYKIFQCWQNYL